MSRIALILFLICLAISLSAQCPTNLDVTLLSQADVDDFAADYPDCTTLESLSIGTGIQQNDVNNLSQMPALTTITDFIDVRGTQLTNLFGLHTVTFSKRVSIGYNGQLTDLSGIGNLNNTLSLLEIIKNNALPALGGLDNLNLGGTIRIWDNDLLTKCVYDNFCAELDRAGADISFSGNAGDCVNGLAVKIACGLVDCSPDYAPLMNLYFDTAGPIWTDNTGWADGAAETDCDICNWPGVTCDPIVNRVIGLFLPQNNLRGELPPETGDLEELRVLQLPANQLSGDFPEEMSNLDFLLTVELNNNDFSGPLPAVLEDIPTLQGIILHDNAFTGPLPEAFGNFPISELDLADNELEGCYPANYVSLCGDGVNFSGNAGLPDGGSLAFFENNFCTAAELCGPCHPDIDALLAFYTAAGGANWTNNSGWAAGAAGTDCAPCSWYGVACGPAGRVTEVVLEANNLEGALSLAIADLPELLHLNLNGNNLSGPLPDLSTLTNMDTLRLGANDFTGVFPASILGLTEMTWLALSGNQLAGPLPDLNSLDKLRRIYLHENDFTGPLPGLSALSDLRVLQLDNNEFSGPIPSDWTAANHPFLFRVKANNAGITGELPADLGELPSLNYLNLRDNTLTGCYPENYAAFCGDSLLTAGNADLPLGGDLDFFYEQFCAAPETACSALPVEFAAFSGAVQGKVNRLRWTTAREEATAFHLVQRSVDGLEWDQIGALAAAGESNSPRRYVFLDEAPLPMAFYRVVSEDVDGQRSISSLVFITRQVSNGDLTINRIFPQPAGNRLQIRLAATAATTVTLSLFDGSGRRVKAALFPLNEGTNDLQVALGGLPAGVYGLTLLDALGNLEVRRVVKR
ncbi:MAG: hypothetical protein AB8H12_02070 [Lewinella sp.]